MSMEDLNSFQWSTSVLQFSKTLFWYNSLKYYFTRGILPFLAVGFLKLKKKIKRWNKHIIPKPEYTHFISVKAYRVLLPTLWLGLRARILGLVLDFKLCGTTSRFHTEVMVVFHVSMIKKKKKYNFGWKSMQSKIGEEKVWCQFMDCF